MYDVDKIIEQQEWNKVREVVNNMTDKLEHNKVLILKLKPYGHVTTNTSTYTIVLHNNLNRNNFTVRIVQIQNTLLFAHSSFCE